jgi:hypothetical protein
MRILLVAASIAVMLFAAPASSSERVRIEYMPPQNRTQEPIMKRLKDLRVLESLHKLLSAFQLPRPLVLRTKDCNGVANAWYEDRIVTMCYEFVAEVMERAPLTTTEQGITREDAIAGTIVQVLLHETGHALFEQLNVPIFGREEDAADQFAGYLILQMHREDARRVIGGVAHMLLAQSTRRALDRDAFSDTHGLPAQRFFNLICLAYGAHPWSYADVVKKGLLP